ncbi:MAG TPA: DUF1643 domain-containing protein [Acetobacteraceae bacterium]|nr:DUF1643 domain-containing protein [Acetobacteraceae bacterium]
MDDFPVRKHAVISSDGRYRYRLDRYWGTRPRLGFVMLNPSTADAELDDPTIRRCMGFARREGAGGIIVCNVYAYRATKPAELWGQRDPHGPENDAHLLELGRWAASVNSPIVCAWGALGNNTNRHTALLMQTGAQLVCLGKTKDGHPRHPLYVRGDQPLEAWK